MPADSGTSQYVIKAKQAQFYRYGPAQSMGADYALNEGTLITLIKRGYGFSQIQTPSGDIGFVANEEIEPDASAEKPAARTLPLLPEADQPELPSVDLRNFDSPEALPEPAPNARPRFRY